MSKSKCFECGDNIAIHQHHVVPKSIGGKNTIPLCEKCHSLVHGKDMKISYLTRIGLLRKNPAIPCRVFYCLTVYDMTPKQISMDLSDILKKPFTVDQARSQIKRLNQIKINDLLDIFDDILTPKECQFYDTEFYKSKWSKLLEHE